MALRQLARTILLRHRRSSDAYVRWLRRNGATIGDNVHFFNPTATRIDSVRIDWVSIGSNCKFVGPLTILAHDYSFSVLIESHHRILQPGGSYVKVGDNVFTGANVTILPGVTIGDNVIIGAGAVVASDIPPDSVVAGVPARVIMSLDEYRLKREANALADANRHYAHLAQSQGRQPSIADMQEHALVFLSRTDENWVRYFSPIHFPGCSRESVHRAFFESAPIMTEEHYFRQAEVLAPAPTAESRRDSQRAV